MSVVADVSYGEVRDWAVWLDTFTAQDLADAMGVDRMVGERGIMALLWHGICQDEGITDSRGDRIISYIPIPPGPNEHFTHAPEWQTCEMEILSPRGYPVRIRSDRDTRKKLAGDMSARRNLMLSEKRYQEMIAAQAARSARNANKIPKWMRKRSAI